jgi:3-hydroxyacyl-[acyl-carrier-protein] dehydratase
MGSNPMTTPPATDAGAGSGVAKLLFDLSGIDLGRIIVTRQGIERYNPHRGDMAMLDGIVWESADRTRCVAVKNVRHDEFWVAGHFPGKPMFPGVLMIEAGAQLACYSWQARQTAPVPIVAFLRIENASFRSMIVPGDTLHILLNEVKFGRRRFISDVQGIVGDRIIFDARVAGMSMGADFRGDA